MKKQISYDVGTKKGYLEIIGKKDDILKVKCHNCEKELDLNYKNFSSRNIGVTCGCKIDMLKRYKEKECNVCKKLFRPRSGKSLYCDECRKDVIKANEKKYRNSNNRIKIGITTGICKVCGGPFVYDGALQIYCKNCNVKAIKEVDSKKSLELYYSKSKEEKEKRNEIRRIIAKKEGRVNNEIL